MQRRLSEHDIDDLVSAYLEGSTVDLLAAQLGVHRTTIMDHLERRGVQRRRAMRKLTDRLIRDAAGCYEAGESLKAVAARFGVDARTLARELRRSDAPVCRSGGGEDGRLRPELLACTMRRRARPSLDPVPADRTTVPSWRDGGC